MRILAGTINPVTYLREERMARTRSKSITRREARTRTFADAVFKDCIYRAHQAYRNGRITEGAKIIAIHFFEGACLGVYPETGKPIDIARIERVLGPRQLDVIAHMFCKSLLQQAVAWKEKARKAQADGLPPPPPQTELPGQHRDWFDRMFRTVMRTSSLQDAR